VRRRGVGAAKVFDKKTTSADGAAASGVVSLREFLDIATPDFFGEAMECDSAEFFKFALLRVEMMVATEMYPGSIC